MHKSLKDIPERILDLAVTAVGQTNRLAVFDSMGGGDWPSMSILTSSHAVELTMKAVIAKQHPLLIFKDLFSLQPAAQSQSLDIETLIARGKTYDMQHLPALLRAVCDEEISNAEDFELLRRTRNSVQHFCAPPSRDLSDIALRGLYHVAAPLLRDQFGITSATIDEDRGGDNIDYVIECLVRREILFDMPSGYEVFECDVLTALKGTTSEYRSEMAERFAKQGVKFR